LGKSRSDFPRSLYLFRSDSWSNEN
jgi:hypothetical protein